MTSSAPVRHLRQHFGRQNFQERERPWVVRRVLSRSESAVAMPGEAEAPLSLAEILTFKHGIKRPQLIGIVAGCIVFLVTIMTGSIPLSTY